MMLETKRGGGDLTKGSEGKRTRSLVSGDLYWYTNQGVWEDLGEEGALNLSKSVVSLALFDGDIMLFSSSGIAIECRMDGTKFLTSASLVRALKNNQGGKYNNLKIEVCYEGNIASGFLEEYDLRLEIAIVKIKSSFSVRAVFLYHFTQFLPCCDVVSLGRDTSGKLIVTTGKLIRDSGGYKERKYLMFSSCKLSEVWEGGPLFSYNGKFVGMNLIPSMKKSLFLPASLIIERLQHFRTSQERNEFITRVKDLKTVKVGEKLTDDTHYSQPEGGPSKDHQGELGYPSPTDSGMVLLYNFEDSFGDLYHNGVWKKFGGRVSRKIRRSVVSLASFSGATRIFACSGIFIHWDGRCDNECQTILTSASLVRNSEYPYDGNDEIIEGLRIEVLLPGKKHREGTLIHYNLHYNVALVSVQELCADPQAILKQGSANWCSKLVAAVGRCFESSELMASSGKLVPWSGLYDFKKLHYSTCRVTKAGIGGPLVDYDGNFMGMNFYDPKVGTPFLLCDDIVDILDCLKTRRTRAEIDSFRIDGDDNVSMNEWPVPLPCWQHPGGPDGIDEHDRKIIASGRKFKYCGGQIWICK